jgi:hypothetical protein
MPKAADSWVKESAPPLLYCFVNACTLADLDYLNQRHCQSWRGSANFYISAKEGGLPHSPKQKDRQRFLLTGPGGEDDYQM